MPIREKFLDNIKSKKKPIINLSNQYPALEDNDVTVLANAVESEKICIKRLILNENNIGDEAANILYKFKDLELLSVSTNNITDQGAKGISSIKTLLDLDITDNDITDEGLSYIVTNLPKLKSLSLSSESIGNKTIQAILKHSALEELNIYGEKNTQIDTNLLRNAMEHVEDNKSKNEANKNNVSEPVSSGTTSGTANTAFFKAANQLEDKENIDSIQQELNEALERARGALKKISNPDQRDKLRKNLIDGLFEFPLLPNSPECKG